MSHPDTRAEHTALPYYLGAQNDQLYITAGLSPALSNDHPNPDADRTVIAKVYDEQAGAALVREHNSHYALVAALKGLLRAGHSLNSSSLEWNAVHAALLKAGAA